MKSKKFFFLILSLGIILVFSFFLRFSRATKSFGVLKTTENNMLQTNINKFMESQKSKYVLGKDNYHCGNKLYGYDDKYAYASVYCSGFVLSDTNELEQGSAFSTPMRFEYKLPDFKIINGKQPEDGSNYSSSLHGLFPQTLYGKVTDNTTDSEIQNLTEEVKKKAEENK